MPYGRSRSTALLITLLCCLSAAGAPAEEQQSRFIYQWTDDRGVIHITDSLQNVPKKYRSQATQVEQSPADEENKDGQQQAQPPSLSGSGSDAGASDEIKKAEWQQRILDAKRRLADAEDRYLQLEKRKSELAAQWGSSGAALPPQDALDEMQRIDDDMTNVKREIDTARNLIENVIPDEARKAGIPPGWLREVE